MNGLLHRKRSSFLWPLKIIHSFEAVLFLWHHPCCVYYLQIDEPPLNKVKHAFIIIKAKKLKLSPSDGFNVFLLLGINESHLLKVAPCWGRGDSINLERRATAVSIKAALCYFNHATAHQCKDDMHIKRQLIFDWMFTTYQILLVHVRLCEKFKTENNSIVSTYLSVPKIIILKQTSVQRRD